MTVRQMEFKKEREKKTAWDNMTDYKGYTFRF